MKKPTKISLAAALADLSLAPPKGRQPGEFTVYDVYEEWGLTVSGADTRLRALTSKGQLIRRVGRENSRAVAFYRKP